ncbi:DUF3368 domain-containing protein [cf. Phormidesmis sp. LEGE 11477]|uniref:DUF3368 domain-containing protein n=1 Tax=cf. Phormidesmis sp. LEGE 11477 TaxID=1828680 RepID=UPI00351D6E92
MPILQESIVSDSTCLIGLERINRLDILPQLYSTFWIPPAVKAEVGFALPWLKVRQVENQTLVNSFRSQIGWGESEAIALALELEAITILLDDKKARRVAEQFDLSMTGTVGMLLKAKRQGVVDMISPILGALGTVEFHISPALRRRALELANES